MSDKKRKKLMEFSDLPPTDTTRWVKSRKSAVVRAIEEGLLTDESACKRYNLSTEELTSWKNMLNRFGPDALRTTHLKRYRTQDSRDQDFTLPPV